MVEGEARAHLAACEHGMQTALVVDDAIVLGGHSRALHGAAWECLPCTHVTTHVTHALNARGRELEARSKLGVSPEREVESNGS